MDKLKTILVAIIFFAVGVGVTSGYYYIRDLHRAADMAQNYPPPHTQSETAEKPAASPPPAALPAAPQITLTKGDLTLAGLSYGASAGDLRNKFGEPDEMGNKAKFHLPGTSEYFKYKGLFSAYVTGGLIISINVDERNGMPTGKNISVGSSADAVIAAYGEPSFRDNEHYIYRLPEDPRVGFDFELNNGLVSEITCGMLD